MCWRSIDPVRASPKKATGYIREVPPEWRGSGEMWWKFVVQSAIHVVFVLYTHMLNGAGIVTNICPKNHPNVGKYTIHGAYGIWWKFYPICMSGWFWLIVGWIECSVWCQRPLICLCSFCWWGTPSYGSTINIGWVPRSPVACVIWLKFFYWKNLGYFGIHFPWRPLWQWGNPPLLVNIENGPVEIVDFPMKNCDVP